MLLIWPMRTVPANDIIKAIKLDELSIIKSSALAEFLNDITEKTLIFGSFKIVNLASKFTKPIVLG